MPGILKLEGTNIATGDGNGAVTLGSAVTVPASIGGTMIFLEKFTASNTAEKIFNLDSFTSYNTYVFSLNGLISVADDVTFLMQVGTSSSSFFSSGGDYRFASSHPYFDGSTAGGPYVDTAQASLAIAPNLGNNAGYGINGTIKLFNPTSSSLKTSVRGEIASFNKDEFVQPRAFAGYRLATTDDAYVKIKFDGTSIASGTITLYGIKDA
mgnify:FL=1|tara:strand:- start:8993 stop:9622 length:630 start_codon:yes stop_codon:yes gene_type:complete